MRKFLLAALALVVLAGLGFAGSASAALRATTSPATCVVFQNPTVEFVWSHICHF